MSDTSQRGRHRTATRHNPLAELAGMAARAGDTSVKATAVLAASGGLVAAFALPASASPAPAAPAPAAAAPVAAPASPVAAPAAPALVAPALAAPARPMTFGVAGIKVVAKPKPKPVVVPVVDTTATQNSNQGSGTSQSGNSQSGTNQSSSQQSRNNSTASRSNSRQSTTSSQGTNTQSSTQTQQAPVRVVQSVGGVVSIARGLLGIPYVFGGTTPAGFDCSGFTQYVFAKAGKSIPRTASAQQAAATRVSNPQPGDLVFFGYPAFHVGIYTGPGTMIDSPRSGKSTSERAIWSSNVSYGRF